jgi:hypothetical protein
MLCMSHPRRTQGRRLTQARTDMQKKQTPADPAIAPIPGPKPQPTGPKGNPPPTPAVDPKKPAEEPIDEQLIEYKKQYGPPL